MTTRHILIVDDEPRVAFFLSKALEHADQEYRVSVAHSGEEALETLNRAPVDLLVTDLRMPGINGLELMRWVRASKPQTRTILITAYGNDEVETEAHRLEAYRYITKPFSLDAFTQVAQEALSDMAVSQPGMVVLSPVNIEVEALVCRDTRRTCVYTLPVLTVIEGLIELLDSLLFLWFPLESLPDVQHSSSRDVRYPLPHVSIAQDDKSRIFGRVVTDPFHCGDGIKPVLPIVL